MFQYPYNERVATVSKWHNVNIDKFQYPYNEQVATGGFGNGFGGFGGFQYPYNERVATEFW